jgi:hypothetical protein
LNVGGKNGTEGHVQLGVCLLSGLYAFALLERLLSSTSQWDGHQDEDEHEAAQDSDSQNNNSLPVDMQKKLARQQDKKSPKWHWNPFYGLSSKRVSLSRDEDTL